MSIIADTAADLRRFSVEGPSGFLHVGSPSFRPKFRPGIGCGQLDWPNGCRALLFSAEDPESTRGASGSFFWWDELAKAKYADLGWSNMLFGMREGANPRGIVTTTPRPLPLIKKLLKSPSTFVTTGSTWDNQSNLSEVFYKQVIEPLEGTRVGRQEINAELVDDLPGALWTRAMIDSARETRTLPDFNRTVAADRAARCSGDYVHHRGHGRRPEAVQRGGPERVSSCGIAIVSAEVPSRHWVRSARLAKRLQGAVIFRRGPGVDAWRVRVILLVGRAGEGQVRRPGMVEHAVRHA